MGETAANAEAGGRAAVDDGSVVRDVASPSLMVSTNTKVVVASDADASGRAAVDDKKMATHPSGSAPVGGVEAACDVAPDADARACSAACAVQSVGSTAQNADERVSGAIGRAGVVQWVAHPSPYGVPYYHNARTGESRWALPTGPRDVVVPAAPKAPAEGPVADSVFATSLPCGNGFHHGEVAGLQHRQQRPPLQSRSGAASSAPVACSGSSSGDTSSSEASSSSPADEEQGDVERRQELGVLKGVAAKLEAFRSLLVEKKVGRFDRYEMWQQRLLVEPRFCAVPKDLRRQLFLKEQARLGERQGHAKALARKRARNALSEFIAVAKERGFLNAACDAPAVVARISQSDLGEDRRWLGVEASARERFVAAALRESREEEGAKAEEMGRAFRSLLQDRVLSGHCSSGPLPPWEDAQRMLSDDDQYRSLGSPDLCRRIYSEMVQEAERQTLQAVRRRKQDKDEMAEQRKRSRRTKVEDEFRSLVLRHVRSPLEVSWAEARILLSGEAMPEEIDDAGREGIFNELREEEATRRHESFATALRQASADVVGLESSFEQARSVVASRLAAGEAQFTGLPAASLRRIWEDWRRARIDEAVGAFRLWIRQRRDLLPRASADAEVHEGRG
eukprot:CAMPEP_0117609908 /NCGR_PEP_ID=MMETSP0784-20121206/81589_1 /TAXON_ID=39447 /ORGANISM="" /LENGTH=622 /DNA_ID=CAMNT_0005413273 /DNA_START=35 /DNA_END=1899 /DNA_ORIENTATION=-